MPKEKNSFRIPVYGKGDWFLARPQIAGTITARDSSYKCKSVECCPLSLTPLFNKQTKKKNYLNEVPCEQVGLLMTFQIKGQIN